MIPKTIHRIWIGDEIPEQHEEYWSKAQDRYPNYEFKTWCGDEFELINEELFQCQEIPAAASDILRLEVIYKYGGIYIDTDVELLQAVPDGYDDLFCAQSYVGATNAFFGAAPGHAVIKKALDRLQELPIESLPEGHIHLVTGPDLMIHIMKDSPEALLPVGLFPFSEEPLDVAIAVHHSEGNWGAAPAPVAPTVGGCLPCQQQAYREIEAELAWRDMRDMRGMTLEDAQLLNEDLSIWAAEHGYREITIPVYLAWRKRTSPTVPPPSSSGLNLLNAEPNRFIDMPCILVARNEMQRLPYFLEYHRALGVDWFLVVDNNSTDGSVSYLLNQPDVSVWHTKEPYHESNFGTRWTTELLDRYGAQIWTLILDADELFVYPDSDQYRTLADFTMDLEQEGCSAVAAAMLDMYSDVPIAETVYEIGSNIQELCRYFEFQADPDEFYDAPGFGLTEVGVSWRQFKLRGSRRKYPLVRHDVGAYLEVGLHTARDRRVSTARAAILHYKYISTLPAYAEESVETRAHWAASALYCRLKEEFDNGAAERSLYEEGISHWYSGTSQLKEMGLVRDPVKTYV
jgi:hypothetical protein